MTCRAGWLMRSFDTSARESGDDRISDPVSTPCILSRCSYQTIRTLLRRGCHFYVAQSKAVCAVISLLDAGFRDSFDSRLRKQVKYGKRISRCAVYPYLSIAHVPSSMSLSLCLTLLTMPVNALELPSINTSPPRKRFQILPSFFLNPIYCI